MKTHLTSDSIKGCSGQWLQCAKEVLLLNGIDSFQFVTSIKDLFIHGRCKNRNLIITGPASYAKKFMLKPFKIVFSYSIFKNSANDKYALVGSEKAKVFFLNNFRGLKDLIPWHIMLLLLEGETVKLPAPKWRYYDLSWCCYICNRQEFNQAQRLLQCKWWWRQRWWLPDGKTMSLAINFLHKRKKIYLLPKMLCKISIFLLEHLTFSFTKVSDTLLFGTNTLRTRYHCTFWVNTRLMHIKQHTFKG